MRCLAFLLLLASFVACDPYGFGFKMNPAFVLDEAFKAVSNLDEESFQEVSAKEALCIYGNKNGINYLKDKVVLNLEDIKINPNVLNSKHYKNPLFVGYWAYYSERYQVDIQEKKSKKIILKAIVDCNYGTENQKDEKLVGLNPKNYKKKECKLIKIIPTEFQSLPLPKKCEVLKVDL